VGAAPRHAVSRKHYGRQRYVRTAMSTSLRSSNLLFGLALATDLLTPFLIWKGVLPAYTRWLSHAALVTMIMAAYARMMVMDRIPGAVLALVWVSVTGIAVAVLRGQGIAATAWGWWIMFQYPLVGLYAYLQPHWPERFPRLVRTACVVILCAEVVVQIGQYLTGEPPGDNLAGTFGKHGTADLVVFIVLVLCLALGRWLASGRWKTLLLVLALGSVSSVLGEIKLFPVAALGAGMATMAIYIFQRRQLRKVAQYAIVMGAVVWVFFGAYNAVVLPARGTRPLEAYLDPATLAEYLGGLTPVPDTGSYYGRYHVGRNYALSYAWDAISRDTTTFLFGWGLGARGESRTLGTAGLALLQGSLGLTTGTSLLVMMQEMGVVGMVLLAGSILWAVLRLRTDISTNPLSDATELRYALLLFSVLWPLWLWYARVWAFRVPMLVYWAALGYVLAEPMRDGSPAQQPRIAAAGYDHCEDTAK
jgi:hypothetical protein